MERLGFGNGLGLLLLLLLLLGNRGKLLSYGGRGSSRGLLLNHRLLLLLLLSKVWDRINRRHTRGHIRNLLLLQNRILLRNRRRVTGTGSLLQQLGSTLRRNGLQQIVVDAIQLLLSRLGLSIARDHSGRSSRIHHTRRIVQRLLLLLRLLLRGRKFSCWILLWICFWPITNVASWFFVSNPPWTKLDELL